MSVFHTRKSLLFCLFLAACSAGGEPAPDTSVAVDTVAEIAPDTSGPSRVTPVNSRPLSPLADSISQRLVFVPVTQAWFVAAARAKRLLVDIGRVDATVAQPPARLAAFKEAVAARSPLQPGTRLRLRGTWGADDVTVAGFDVWNGRIVATLNAVPRVDSLARSVDPLVAVAQRADSATPSIDAVCVRLPVDSAMDRRASAIRDSILQLLVQGDRPSYPRLLASLKERGSRATGCFQGGRAIVVALRVAGDYEWVRERAFLVSDTGKPAALTVRDFRFRAHDLLPPFDADEDGFDEVVARAYTERGGGTVVLRLVDAKRLERLAAGFSYER